MKSEHLPLLFKLYVWSLILEPLLFFVLGQRSLTGVTANLSRILQFLIVLCLVYSMVASTFPRRLVHPFNRYYFHYTAYVLLAAISGVYGVMSGAYDMPLAYHTGESGFASELNSAWLRPFFEYCVALYYFFYFVVLPQLFLTSRSRLTYFFDRFFIMFNASLVLGLIDVVVAQTGFVFIGRHLSDWISVGARFHGLAGEPRDAFVYLLFGIAIAYMRSQVAGTRIRRSWMALVVVAALLTQSASGLLGLVIFLALLLVAGLVRLNRSALTAALVSIVVLVPAIIAVVENTERLVAYQKVLLVIWDILERHDDIPMILTGQVNNIYPVYHLISKVREWDLLPLLIGYGFGSASAINNVMGSWDELTNPSSQLIRLVYESGLLGFALFVLAFYRPMELLTAHLPARKRRVYLMLTLLLMGAFLGHRSAALYIFLGIAMATLRPAWAGARAIPLLDPGLLPAQAMPALRQ